MFSATVLEILKIEKCLKVQKSAESAYFCTFKHFSIFIISKTIAQNVTNHAIFGKNIENSIY